MSMQVESPSPSLEPMRGQPLAMRVDARIQELRAAMENLLPEEVLRRTTFETELAIAANFMTGDPQHPSDVVAHDMSEWLERNKYLA